MEHLSPVKRNSTEAQLFRKLLRERRAFDAARLPPSRNHSDESGYLEDYPAAFDIWVLNVRHAIQQTFPPDSVQSSLATLALECYSSFKTFKNRKDFVRIQALLIDCLQSAVTTVNILKDGSAHVKRKPESNPTIVSQPQTSSNMMRYRLFLSYTSGDSELASELQMSLQRESLACFMAAKDIGVAADWEAVVRDALRASQSVLLLITPRSLARPWVLLEAGAAWALGKPLIPALVQVSPDQLVEPLRRYQARVIETAKQRRNLLRELKQT